MQKSWKSAAAAATGAVVALMFLPNEPWAGVKSVTKKSALHRHHRPGDNPEAARLRAARAFVAREMRWNRAYYGSPYPYYGSPYYSYGWGNPCYNYSWGYPCDRYRWSYPPYWGYPISSYSADRGGIPPQLLGR